MRYLDIYDKRYQQHVAWINEQFGQNYTVLFENIDYDDSIYVPRDYNAKDVKYNDVCLSFNTIGDKLRARHCYDVRIYQQSEIHPFKMHPDEYKTIKDANMDNVICYIIIGSIDDNSISDKVTTLTNFANSTYYYSDSAYSNFGEFKAIGDDIMVHYVDRVPLNEI